MNGEQSQPLAGKYYLYKYNYKEFYGIAFLFLFLTDFMGIGVYLPLLLLPFVLIYISKNRFPKSFWTMAILLLLFGIIYGLIAYMHGFATKGLVLIVLVYPITLFVFGYLTTYKQPYESSIKYIMWVVISMTLFGFLSVLKTVITFGNMEVATMLLGSRSVLNFWNNEPISATVLNMRLSFGLSLLPVIFLMKDKTLKHFRLIKTISLICFCVSVYSIIQLGNRTGIAIAIISFVLVLVYAKQLKLLNSIKLIFMFLVLTALYNLNTIGIKDKWESSILANRFQTTNALEDSRFTAWRDAFYGLFQYPIGGKQTDLQLGYAHNLWLDVGFTTGIVPFVILVIFSIVSFLLLRKFTKIKHPLLVKSLVIALSSACFVTFFLEPVIEAWFTYFTIYCFILGIVQRLNFEKQKGSI